MSASVYTTVAPVVAVTTGAGDADNRSGHYAVPATWSGSIVAKSMFPPSGEAPPGE